MNNEQELVCLKCKWYTKPNMRFFVRANETRPYVEKEYAFDRRCAFGYKERIRGAIILECSEFIKEE